MIEQHKLDVARFIESPAFLAAKAEVEALIAINIATSGKDVGKIALDLAESEGVRKAFRLLAQVAEPTKSQTPVTTKRLKRA